MDQILKAGQKVQPASSRSNCFVEKFLSGGGQGEVYRAKLGGRPVALKWYYPASGTADQRIALEHLIKMGPPSDRFLWPTELATTAAAPAFGYLMPLRDDRF